MSRRNATPRPLGHAGPFMHRPGSPPQGFPAAGHNAGGGRRSEQPYRIDVWDISDPGEPPPSPVQPAVRRSAWRGWTRAGAPTVARLLRHGGNAGVRLAGSPAGQLASIALAVTLGLLYVRVLQPDGKLLPPSGMLSAPSAGMVPDPAPGSIPRTAAPWSAPLTYPDLAAAARALGQELWEPATLPAGVRRSEVRWQGDATRTVGMLRTSYLDSAGGEVLVLEQGRFIGVTAGCAPEGLAGTSNVQHQVVHWTTGHIPEAGTETHTALDCYWEGAELRLGPPTAAGWGWRLQSDALGLEALLVVAEGLRLVEPPLGPAWVYVVDSEEATALLRQGLGDLTSMQLSSGEPVALDLLIVVDGSANAARVAEAVEQALEQARVQGREVILRDLRAR